MRSVGGGVRVAAVVPLAGRWLSVDAIDLEGPGGDTVRVVLRRWTREGWQETDPDFTPAREAAILERLARADRGLPAPRVLAVDPDGTDVGVPAILLTWLDGTVRERTTPLSDGAIRELAAVLVRVQQAGPALHDATLPFAPFWEPLPDAIPVASRRRDVWLRAIDAVARPPVRGPETFLHRDYHPGNVVWQGDTISGILDWTGACWGPPESDLAHLRVNLAADHGVAEADAAARAWVEAGGRVVDPVYWDVRMLLDWLPDLDDEYASGDGLERLERYLESLLDRARP